MKINLEIEINEAMLTEDYAVRDIRRAVVDLLTNAAKDGGMGIQEGSFTVKIDDSVGDNSEIVFQRVWTYEDHQGAMVSESTNIGWASDEEGATKRCAQFNGYLATLASSDGQSPEYRKALSSLAFYDEQAVNYDWESLEYTWERVPSIKD
jgi:hypothetical protein